MEGSGSTQTFPSTQKEEELLRSETTKIEHSEQPALSFPTGVIKHLNGKQRTRQNSYIRGWPCGPNNQLNVCTTSITEGEEVGPVKLV